MIYWLYRFMFGLCCFKVGAAGDVGTAALGRVRRRRPRQRQGGRCGARRTSRTLHALGSDRGCCCAFALEATDRAAFAMLRVLPSVNSPCHGPCD